MGSSRGRFLLVFFALLVLFEIPLLLEPVDRVAVRPFTAGIASLSGVLLRAIGQPVTVSGTLVAGPCFTVNINTGCNGLEATLFLLAAVLAFPASVKARALATLGGVALIQGLNMVRVLSLYLIGCYRREWFDTFHLAIWQTVIFAAAILFFASWTRGKVPPKDAAQHA